MSNGQLIIYLGLCHDSGIREAALRHAMLLKLQNKDVVLGYRPPEDVPYSLQLTSLETIPFCYEEPDGGGITRVDPDCINARNPEWIVCPNITLNCQNNGMDCHLFTVLEELLERGYNIIGELTIRNISAFRDMYYQFTGEFEKNVISESILRKVTLINFIDAQSDCLPLNDSFFYNMDVDHGAVDYSRIMSQGATDYFRSAAREFVHSLRQDTDRGTAGKVKENANKSESRSLIIVDYSVDIKDILASALKYALANNSSLQALYIETSKVLKEGEQDRLFKNFEVGKQFGIPIRTITQENPFDAITDFVKKEGFNTVFLAVQPDENLFDRIGFHVRLRKLIQNLVGCDIVLLKGRKHKKSPKYSFSGLISARGSKFSEYIIVSAYVFFAFVFAVSFKQFLGYEIVAFALLFFVSVLAVFFGIGPIFLAASLCAILWTYIFVPRQYSFHIEKAEDFMLVLMFFIIALLNGILTSRIKRQEEKIRIREERTHLLYQLTQDLSNISGVENVARIGLNYIERYFKSDFALFLKDGNNNLDRKSLNKSNIILDSSDYEIAEDVFKRKWTGSSRKSVIIRNKYSVYPLAGYKNNIGILILLNQNFETSGEEQFWETILFHISSNIEREILRNEAKMADFLNESDKLYKTLFNSISHEFRIPVAAILGASDILISHDYSPGNELNLYKEINTASVRLNRLIGNLLNISRLESGHLKPHFDWYDLHDLINNIQDALKLELSNFSFNCRIDDNFPLFVFDFGLLEQTIYNLILNSTQNSLAGTEIEIDFSISGDSLQILVMDRGNGFMDNDINSVFNKFYRGNKAKPGGIGLGLAIAKGFVEAHQGVISVGNRTGGGAMFTILIPKIELVHSVLK